MEERRRRTSVEARAGRGARSSGGDGGELGCPRCDVWPKSSGRARSDSERMADCQGSAGRRLTLGARPAQHRSRGRGRGARSAGWRRSRSGSPPSSRRRRRPGETRTSRPPAETGQRPGLALDAPREAVAARATELIVEAWRSFDRFRPDEPPLGERVRELLAAELPGVADAGARGARRHRAHPRRVDRPAAPALLRVHRLFGARDRRPRGCARLVLRRQPRPLRGAATEVERQALRWVGEFVGYPGTAGAFTSGGTVSNLTALAAARERALPGSRGHGYRLGPPDRVRLRARRTTRSSARSRSSGSARSGLRLVPIDGRHRLVPAALGRGDRPRRAGGRNPGRRRRERGHDAHGSDRPDRGDRRRMRAAVGVAARRRRVRAPGGSGEPGRRLLRWSRPRRLGNDRRAQVALPPESLRRRARSRSGDARCGVRARGELHAP